MTFSVNVNVSIYTAYQQADIP